MDWWALSLDAQDALPFPILEAAVKRRVEEAEPGYGVEAVFIDSVVKRNQPTLQHLGGGDASEWWSPSSRPPRALPAPGFGHLGVQLLPAPLRTP